MPPIHLMPILVTDAIGIAVVAFVVTASLGKLFAKKHHYHVDPRQVHIDSIDDIFAVLYPFHARLFDKLDSTRLRDRL